ncbi:MAG: DUF3450 family protein [Verrucomicrobiota bacterium]
MILRLCLLLVALLWCASLGYSQEPPPPPEELQKKIAEWVRTQQIYSEEESEWSEQQRRLSDLNELRQVEIDRLSEAITKAQGRVDEIMEKQDEFAEERSELRAWRRDASRIVEGLEKKLRPLTPLMPVVLRERAEESILRLEAGPDANAALQNRVRDILLVLREFSDFQRTLTVDRERREIDGEEREIELLYFGLDQAYYVDPSNSYAGHGYPTLEGWVWVEDNSLANDIRETLQIQGKQLSPAFSSLPFTPRPATDK